jgi:hypothetical protein
MHGCKKFVHEWQNLSNHKKMVWDKSNAQQFPALGNKTKVVAFTEPTARKADQIITPLKSFGYTNVIDLHDSNKFMPSSKLSPKMNERMQNLPLIKKQAIYDNRQKVRDLFFKLRRLYRESADLWIGDSSCTRSTASGNNPFTSTRSKPRMLMQFALLFLI